VSPRRFAALALAACLPACLVAGCASDSRQGYAFGTGFPADIKSVSVPIFRNASTTPGIEADVTEAIIKELQRAGGMTITTAQGADTTLTGVITDVRMKRLSVRSGTPPTASPSLQPLLLQSPPALLHAAASTVTAAH
jgi:hypothetical protein